MTKQEAIAVILECKKKLGRVPKRTELWKQGLGRQQIIRHFGSYTRALYECNLEPTRGKKLEMAALFEDWARVARTLRRIPSMLEYEELSVHSTRPLRLRFGSWNKAPAGLKQYAEEQGLTDEWKDVLDLVKKDEKDRNGQAAGVARPSAPTILPDRPTYGRLMRPCPLLCIPTNEGAVLFLFATMAIDLGFLVLRIQTEFPDCEAFRVISEDRLQKVRIEIEYESRNFLRHGHDVRGCDIIVCWAHNWPQCPLEVIELRSYLTDGEITE